MPTHPAHRHHVPSARELRERETLAERRLWTALRARRPSGLKFRRQHPIGPFLADFCCPERHLMVEIDGPVHERQRDHDAEGEEVSIAAGYRVLRFGNDEVLGAFAEVLGQIRGAALERPIVPSSERSRSRGW